MPWIDVIDEAHADGALKAAYEEIKGARGKVANIMRIHSLKPETMLAHKDLYVSLLFRDSGLSREERELIAVVISAANGCAYCVQHHAEALDHYWQDRARVDRAVRDFRALDLPDRLRAILAYVVKLTEAPATVTEVDVAALRAVGLSDADILSVNLVTAYFNFVNRIAVGLGVEFSPEEVTGYRY
ncbi:MAG: peroxidase-related enzyme [Anaerolineae bacterium]|nr:peroxidase-related enzyme [Anaerolineae bacterium]